MKKKQGKKIDDEDFVLMSLDDVSKKFFDMKKRLETINISIFS